MSNRASDNSFDALRLGAALLVVFGHAFRLTGASGPQFAGTGIATTGVKIFFVISGYLVAQSWRRDPHPLRFMLRRLLRLVPGLVAVVLLTATVLGPMVTDLPRSGYFADPATWAYLENIAFRTVDVLPGVFGGNAAPGEVNGSLWSLPAEMSMYLLLPPLAMLSLTLTGAYRFFAATAVALTLAAALALRPLPGVESWLVYGLRVWALAAVAPFFLCGAAIALCGWERHLHRGTGAVLLIALAFVNAPSMLLELLLVPTLTYGVLALALKPVPGLGGATRAGDLSYGLYLYAFPIQQTLVARLGTPGGAVGNFVLAASLAAVCGFLSWHLIEKRALRYKPRARALPSPRSVASDTARSEERYPEVGHAGAERCLVREHTA